MAAVLVASLAAAGPSADQPVASSPNAYLEVDSAGTVVVDGQEMASTEGDATVALELAPGTHAVELTAKDGSARIERELVVVEDEVAVLALRLGAEPFRLGEGIDPPTAIEQAQPTMLADLARGGVSGATILECVIDVNGNVQVNRVLKASHPETVPSAIAAVSSWRYEPAMQQGVPVPVFLTVRLQYGERRM